MKFISLTCDKCGATLEVDLDQGYGFCPHCGNQVYTDFSDEVLIEKEKTKRKKIDYILHRDKQKNKSESEESGIIIFCQVFLMISGAYLILYIFHFIIFEIGGI